ncbi:hypothetical protein [Christiangramia sp. SM2212]|uniref:Uncharacterized protein n=1 Tax=Christiangramia sediminicola TaxID=3073267 RepID=A0ABU1ETZ9_9FLAO|nr:hypothetical protein [Christiangramia sp. SM2212]MDR5591866.1 hypothetical protein [Christiangramia sp. SM2212]
MRKSTDYQNIDSLILNIRAILSEDRCSLSEEEKIQLNDTISYLENSRKVDVEKPIDWSIVFKAVEILLKVFTNLENLNDFF